MTCFSLSVCYTAGSRVASRNSHGDARTPENISNEAFGFHQHVLGLHGVHLIATNFTFEVAVLMV